MAQKWVHSLVSQERPCFSSLTNIVRLLLSFISLYRYIVISFIFIESACPTGWPSPLSTSSPAANQSRRGEYTKVAALQVGLLSLNVLADAASSNSLCRQVSLFIYLQFWICAVAKGWIYQGCCITGYSLTFVRMSNCQKSYLDWNVPCPAIN